MPMRVQIQVRIVSDDDTVLSEDVLRGFDKGKDQLEGVGLSLEEAKTMLACAQTSLVAAQAASFLARHRCCELCGRHLQSKGFRQVSRQILSGGTDQPWRAVSSSGDGEHIAEGAAPLWTWIARRRGARTCAL